MFFAQCLKFSYAGVPSFARYEHALFTARAIGKYQVVSGRQTPLVSRVQKEQKILHVIIAIMSKDVEAGQCKQRMGEGNGVKLRRTPDAVLCGL